MKLFIPLITAVTILTACNPSEDSGTAAGTTDAGPDATASPDAAPPEHDGGEADAGPPYEDQFSLSVHVPSPIVLGGRVAASVGVRVPEDAILSGSWPDLKVRTTDSAVVTAVPADSAEQEEWITSAWVEATGTGTASVEFELPDGPGREWSGPLTASQEVSVAALDAFAIETCPSRTIAPGPLHTFTYTMEESGGGDIFGDPGALVEITQEGELVEITYQPIPAPGTLSFLPAIGETLVRVPSIDFSEALQFIAPAAITEIMLVSVDVGERGLGEFGTANLELAVAADGVIVCVEDEALISARVVEGTDCVVTRLPRTSLTSRRVENRGAEGCTVEFFIEDSLANPIQVDVP